jgi:nucleotide-binding universal stress UspA family protein
MSTFPTKILLATDGSEEATLAADAAASLAASTGSELHLLTVGPEYPYYELPEAPAYFEEILEAQKREARKVLDGQVARIEESGAAIEETHLGMGERPDRRIVDLAERLGAGLVVVGSRGLTPLRRVAMGSVSDSVVRHAHCPVMVVRADGGGEASYPPGRILLALDGSEQADAAARMAVELAASTDSELHVAHVGEIVPVYHPERHAYSTRIEEIRKHAAQVLDEQVEKVKSAGGTVAGSHLKMGPPEEEIAVLAEELGAGLIAMGSRGLGGIRRALMGSVSLSVVRHAPCSVLVVREDG